MYNSLRIFKLHWAMIGILGNQFCHPAQPRGSMPQQGDVVMEEATRTSFPRPLPTLEPHQLLGAPWETVVTLETAGWRLRAAKGDMMRHVHLVNQRFDWKNTDNHQAIDGWPMLTHLSSSKQSVQLKLDLRQAWEKLGAIGGLIYFYKVAPTNYKLVTKTIVVSTIYFAFLSLVVNQLSKLEGPPCI